MREAILRYLSASPGASTSMVARHLGTNASTADYHLRRMRKDGLVGAHEGGRVIAWYAAGCGLCPVVRSLVPALRHPPFEATLRALGEVPAHAPWIAQQAGVDAAQARWATAKLVAVGVAVRSPSGKVRLAEGASLCARKTLGAEPCDLWGKCPVSRARTQRRDG